MTTKSISLRDVMFLCRPIAKDKQQEKDFKDLAENKLKSPDSWEVEISAKGNNKESWERLLSENKLGAFAFIRNLRNMVQANVDDDLIRKYFLTMKGIEKILPFRYLSAAAHAPKFEPELEQAMFKNLAGKEKLPGKTVVIVDVSGSMYNTPVSEKSEMDRAKAACAVAVLARELCENVSIYATAGNDGTRIHKTQLVPSRRGFALSDAIFQLCRP
ncbi:MAG: TROVE domain-containing protein, partial [Candidatus Aenigmarchaeota archaeon]|nr:TROVE domain-containing protein [Candidatus Aenigmarchaeota archaeon]